MSRSVLNGGTRRRAAELAVATGVTLFSSLAHAHFSLQAPPNWTAEDAQGSPQKDWPCGNEGNPMSTGPTTAFKAGDKITIQLAETVMHPGYYRVAIATSGNMMDLPQDMSADASGGNCQNDDKTATPMFPILADGELNHTTKLNGVQSFDVTLPTDISCDKCVLQVREYMEMHSNQAETTSGQAAHMNGCYYHHCAYISVSGGSSGAGGMSSSGGAPNGGAGGSTGGMPGGAGMSMGGVSMGGAMGEAGTLMSSGGMPGSSGGPGAGRSGAGAAGMTGSSGGSAGKGGGGNTGTGGTTSNGGAIGTGGTATGAGGSTSGSPAASGGGRSAPASNGNDQSGGCNIATRRGSAPFAFAAALGLGLWFARRRRR
jgi:hypothetical protein